MKNVEIALFILLVVFFASTFASQDNDKIQYVFPQHGSQHLPAGTEILLRFERIQPQELDNLSDVMTIQGRQSGAVKGSISVLSDHRTIHFQPDMPFKPGETVSVFIAPVLKKSNNALMQKSIEFTIYAGPEHFEKPQSTKKSNPEFFSSNVPQTAEDPVILNGVAIPKDFPRVNILLSDNPAPGHIFINHGRNQSTKYHMILDNTGAPVWYLRSNHGDPRNFNVHATGEIAFNANLGENWGAGYYTMDNTFSITDSFTVNWNGYRMDDHEFLLLEDGRYFMVGFKYYTIDMSQYMSGGRNNVNVRETAIFGYPAGSKTPNFIWRAFDHFNVADTDDPGIDDLSANSIRFPHMNAIKMDTDGNILLSSRHLSEITKINYQTGEIIWRLGGKHNQFTFINDEFNGPSNQHDVQPLGNNHYSVFDNGNQHAPQISRAVEWELDIKKMTATVVWEYRNTEANGSYSHYMGNHQKLANGNRMINWAASNWLSKLATEVTADGEKTLELEFADDDDVYRIFKYQWYGVAQKPYLLLERYSDAVTLIFNKFGDTEVDYYNIYAGTTPFPTTVVATTDQPFIHLAKELINYHLNYFRVTAVNINGVESDFSNQESVYVNILNPGENMLSNGDFTNGFESWEWVVRNANADFEITNDNKLHFIINDGGSEDWNVQAVHPGLSLVHGETYVLEFDAYATANRPVYFDVRKDGDPWTNFSQIGGTVLTREQKHFKYEFVMQEPSEPKARIVLNVGGYDSDVYVDNVSFKQLPKSNVTHSLKPIPEPTLQQNYPNPFNPATVLHYTLSQPEHVTLSIYNLLGRHIITLVDNQKSAGTHKVMWTPVGLSNGIYLCQFQAGDFTQTRKLIFQK